jgi:hypothetical protein
VDRKKSDADDRINPGLFVVPKKPVLPKAKLISYSASGQVMIQSEFSDGLEERTKAYIAEFKPNGITELCLVRDLASSECRCEYIQRLIEQLAAASDEKTILSLKRYQATNQGTFKRSHRELKKIQKARAAEAARKPQLVKPKTAGGY